VREGGQLKEKVWKVGGMYSGAIEKIVYWLEKAVTVAENPNQKRALEKLVAYYKTGDLKQFDEYNIAWVNDVNSVVDVVNGFIETYEDPLSKKGSFESVVSIRDFEASKRIQKIGSFAQWFEDNSPIAEEHKKENVKGISAKVITVVVESGDASPSTPIGINLPNSNWIREKHGSKSVQLGNIVHAYDHASKGSGFLQEFCFTEEEQMRAKEFSSYADVLHTDMHEVIGHASGKINEGIATPDVTLENYASTLEEARADLVALYYLFDDKLVEIGVMESLEYGKAAYEDYIRNGMMTQLMRLELGEDLEEAHMRNRQLIAMWAYEKGKEDNVIERKEKEGKTYFVVNDYSKLKTIFGDLLKEIQRIKSEGDYDSGKALVEDYGVKVDRQLHNEVLERYEKLNIAPYSGFINPTLTPVMNDKDEIVDVKVEYTHSFKEQMLHYAKEYSFLPTYN
jgi:dipeptidyl-peptidase-3